MKMKRHYENSDGGYQSAWPASHYPAGGDVAAGYYPGNPSDEDGYYHHQNPAPPWAGPPLYPPGRGYHHPHHNPPPGAFPGYGCQHSTGPELNGNQYSSSARSFTMSSTTYHHHRSDPAPPYKPSLCHSQRCAQSRHIADIPPLLPHDAKRCKSEQASGGSNGVTTMTVIIHANSDNIPVPAALCSLTMCKLCNARLNAPNQAKAHYEGKHHGKQIRRYFEAYKKQRALGCVIDDMQLAARAALQTTGKKDPTAAGKGQKEGSTDASASPSSVPAAGEGSGSVVPVSSSSAAAASAAGSVGGGEEEVGGGSTLQQQQQLPPPARYCPLCNATFNGPSQAEKHYQGKAHQRRIRARAKILLAATAGATAATASESGTTAAESRTTASGAGATAGECGNAKSGAAAASGSTIKRRRRRRRKKRPGTSGTQTPGGGGAGSETAGAASDLVNDLARHVLLTETISS